MYLEKNKKKKKSCILIKLNMASRKSVIDFRTTNKSARGNENKTERRSQG